MFYTYLRITQINNNSKCILTEKQQLLTYWHKQIDIKRKQNKIITKL